MKRKILAYIILLIAVTLAGEFQIYPGVADIRISLGTPVFFLFLLWSKQIKPIPSGILVGITVVFFRSIILATGVYEGSWADAFLHYAPVFLYYVVYGFSFHLFKVRSIYKNPIIIVLIGMVIENLASWAEAFFRNLLFHVDFSIEEFITIFLISVFRSFFVLGIISFSLLKEANFKTTLQKKRNDEMLLLVSDLFVEKVQLKKSMRNAENITHACYELYQDLMKDKQNTYAKRALEIAGEVHEIKKDNQRVHAGLSKLKVNEQTSSYMDIKKIVEVAVKSNESYAKQLKKSIHLHVDIRGEHPYYDNLVVLSLINNLISNAIEAIDKKGKISVLVSTHGDKLKIVISDNGPGIPARRQALVFEPGYTTKYDSAGLASNGIGLSHIKEVIEDLEGQITLSSDPEQRNTTFAFQLPIENISYRGLRYDEFFHR